MVGFCGIIFFVMLIKVLIFCLTVLVMLHFGPYIRIWVVGFEYQMNLSVCLFFR